MNDKNHNDLLNEELHIVFLSLIKRGLSKAEVEDIIQETAYRYLLYFDSIRSNQIRSWLFRVALNIHYDQLRKKRWNELIIDDFLSLSDPEEGIEELYLRKEKRNEIQNVISKLKPQHQELLLLKYYSSLSYKEISQILNVSVETVKRNLHQARLKFQKIYKEESW